MESTEARVISINSRKTMLFEEQSLFLELMEMISAMTELNQKISDHFVKESDQLKSI